MLQLIVGAILAACLAASPAESREVAFAASDSVTVFADLYETDTDRAAPLILLFHQGGSNARGEYADSIAPRLVEAGFHVLAPDARAGGDRYGGVNRTAAAHGAMQDGYCWAYPDIVAALDWARAQGFDGPIVAWGSSYSAALVLRLGVERADDLAGVLSFSPASGAPMGECSATNYLGMIAIPVFLALPRPEFEAPVKAEFIEAAREAEHVIHVQPEGVHGSSMLHPGRAEGGTEAMWTQVLAFLAEVCDAAADE